MAGVFVVNGVDGQFDCQSWGWAVKRRRAKRSPESYVSRDPAKRAAQRSNLHSVPPGPGPGRPATHGGYAKVASARLDAKVAEVFAAIAEDAPLRAADGGLPAADSAAVLELAETGISKFHARGCGWQAGRCACAARYQASA